MNHVIIFYCSNDDEDDGDDDDDDDDDVVFKVYFNSVFQAKKDDTSQNMPI